MGTRGHMWLFLGMPFRDAVRLLVADPEGPEYEPEDFVWAVLEAKLHVERNPARAATQADERREAPDDIRMQFSRTAALILRLRSRVIDCYIPLERIKADCAEVFGGRCDVGKLFADAEAEMSADKKSRAAEEVCEKIWALAGEHEDYNGPLVKTTDRKNIVNHGLLHGGGDFAADGRA